MKVIFELNRLLSECAWTLVQNLSKGRYHFRQAKTKSRLMFGFQEVGNSSNPAVKAQPGRKLFLLDLFCGTTGVAAAFQTLGGEALGLDHLIDKRRVKGPVAKVDLLTKKGQHTVVQWIT